MAKNRRKWNAGVTCGGETDKKKQKRGRKGNGTEMRKWKPREV
jgi:hypothetical protein